MCVYFGGEGLLGRSRLETLYAQSVYSVGMHNTYKEDSPPLLATQYKIGAISVPLATRTVAQVLAAEPSVFSTAWMCLQASGLTT